jgi:hypothetical protein
VRWIARPSMPRYRLGAVTNDEPDGYVIIRMVVAAGCAYEVFALVTQRVPTLSHVCRTNRWVEGLVLSCLVLHFHRLKTVQGTD